MKPVMSLTREGRELVDEAFLAGGDLSPVESRHEEALPTAVDVTPLLALVGEGLRLFPTIDKQMDDWLVERVHLSLPLTRRLAANPAMWHWLTVVACPDLVRRRWGNQGKVVANRFLGGLNTNTLARLWWIAELTRNGEDYSLSHALMRRSQDLVQLVYEHNFSRHGDVVRAFLAVSDGEGFEVIRELAKVLSYLGATVALESMSTSEVQELLQQFVVEARQRVADRGSSSKSLSPTRLSRQVRKSQQVPARA